MTYNVFGGTLNLAQSIQFNVLQSVLHQHTELKIEHLILAVFKHCGLVFVHVFCVAQSTSVEFSRAVSWTHYDVR